MTNESRRPNAAYRFGRASSPLRAASNSRNRRARSDAPYLCGQTRPERAQQALDFGWVSEQITRCSRFGLLTDENPYPALLQRAKGVLVSLIIADEDRANAFTFQPQRFQQPHHGFAFVPLDAR